MSVLYPVLAVFLGLRRDVNNRVAIGGMGVSQKIDNWPDGHFWEELEMRLTVSAVACMIGLASVGALAADTGTAEEARAMIERAAAALATDPAAALASFNAGADGFREKDLYVFCGDAEGVFTAHGANADLIGRNMRGLVDKAGTPLGENIYAAANMGSVAVVEYMWPRPGETEPAAKASYVTQVGDQTCGVGYYK